VKAKPQTLNHRVAGDAVGVEYLCNGMCRLSVSATLASKQGTELDWRWSVTLRDDRRKILTGKVTLARK
jgi:hypothetical protein